MLAKQQKDTRVIGKGANAPHVLFSPRVLGGYLRLLLGGWRPRKYEGEDVFQLGGDFVLDGRRRLVYAYRSKNPADRPSADELVESVRDAGKTSKSD